MNRSGGQTAKQGSRQPSQEHRSHGPDGARLNPAIKTMEPQFSCQDGHIECLQRITALRITVISRLSVPFALYGQTACSIGWMVSGTYSFDPEMR